MKYAFLIVILFTTHPAFTQLVELGEIHSKADDATSIKMHVKEVIAFEGKSVAYLRQMLESWYQHTYVKNRVIYRYGFSYTNGDMEWKEIHDYLPGQGAFKPYDDTTYNRILTPHILCDDCLNAYKNKRRKNDGYFRLDMRIKEGRVQLVLFEPFDVVAQAWLSAWLIKRKALIKRPDSRFDAIEELFQNVKASLVEFSLDYDGSPHYEPRGKPTKKSIDDW